jgi:hypothetical protein
MIREPQVFSPELSIPIFFSDFRQQIHSLSREADQAFADYSVLFKSDEEIK